MLRRVKIIKSAPKARTGYQVQGSLANDIPAMGGADYNAYIGAPRPEVSKTLTAVPRSAANLEAEGGETVVGNLDGSKMPSFKTIKGPRHSNGGVPLLLPEDSFIFSDTKSMKISDPRLLNMFGVKPQKGGYTPAELSKKYDINNYRKILQDPNSDKIARTTAEIMIKNYVMKLGALALAQESKKAFPQGIPLIARPYMEAMGLQDEDLIPELAMQEEQQMPMQEAEEVEEEFPQTMPDGQPIAQPQPTPQQMPDPGMQPMAQYGMSMGGYDMPFYDLPEAEYGMPMGTGMSQNYMGRRKRMYAGGGDLPKAENGDETVGGIKARPVDDFSQGEGWQKGKTEQSGFEAQYRRKQGEQVRYYNGRTMGTEESVAQGVCAKINKSGNVQQAILESFPAYLKGKREGMPGYEEAMSAAVARLAANPLYADCIKTANQKFEEAEYRTGDTPPPPDENCPCRDKDGNVIPGKFAKRDKDGKCLPCLEECTCTKSDKSTYVVGRDKDGNCEKCEEDITLDTPDTDPPVREPEWWLQDTVNAAGAFGDLMGVRKRMPWEARVDLEEPRPTFLDPTRELAAQSEQANIAAQASAQFAGPQALGSRLSAIQGKGAAAAADTLSRINNQNVGIANQFEGQQVGIRNQEQMLNQQMANRVYDKNVIADQQFQNAKRAGRANMAQAYNTAVTNKWKTDALNQMYPDYQVSAGPGGRLYADPTAKDATATKPEMTMEEFVAANKGMDPKVLDRMLQIKYGKGNGGATTFRDGGFVYTVFPTINF
jgi:hypothetical protein